MKYEVKIDIDDHIGIRGNDIDWFYDRKSETVDAVIFDRVVLDEIIYFAIESHLEDLGVELQDYDVKRVYKDDGYLVVEFEV